MPLNYRMQKYIALFFSVLVFLTACGDNIPKGIIPQTKMTSLLTDIHLADGAMYALPQVPDSVYKYGASKYNLIFKQYHVTPGQFVISFKYYSTRPERLSEMYTQIAATIKRKTDSLNKSGASKINHVIPHQ